MSPDYVKRTIRTELVQSFNFYSEMVDLYHHRALDDSLPEKTRVDFQRSAEKFHRLGEDCREIIMLWDAHSGVRRT